jgi:LmbE family N-acetylglucosaminyl deacetylase
MNEHDPSDPVSEALFGGGTLLGIWAHPDDEAYLSAGLMARTSAGGGRVAVAFATRGEGGTADPARWPPAAMARRREGEAERALSAIGAGPPRFLGHGDGACASVDLSIGAAQVVALIDEIDPDVVVTFGSDGITGHDDHRAVSAWVMAAWHELRRRRRCPPHVLVAAMTDAFVRRHERLHAEIGFFMRDDPRATVEVDLALRLVLSESELDRKGDALAAHASQTRALVEHMGAGAYRRWWAEECFRWPDAAELGGAAEAVAA